MPPPGPDLDFFQDLKPEFDKRTKFYAATDEMHDQARFEKEVPEARRLSARGIEVGHIFYFGTKYSAPMKANVTGPDGKDTPVEMGSYGIGVSRLAGGIIEASHDDKGCIWPMSVAPFEVVVVNLRADDTEVTKVCESAYAQLQKAGFDALYDDTAERPGAKLSTMELIGVPLQIVVGPKGVKAGVVEVKERRTGKTEEMTLEAAINRCIAARTA
jgi:prolyl-tRNA synthetase